ncbi:phage tail tape measure protein [Bacillus paralicheniformis]|uniref:phage tail tape measure protein n=1 Tax=Bacillus TaxID=1386 RepID=UPI000ADAB73E|nr:MULTISPECIES: phage tail tape measure protein [Bacillus subtilis group]MCY9239111.1 phage tail tape measure protein [Bacillus licheniformis]MDQ9095394.1 phage tail tape measure protein [Bacillus licheniformis]MEC0477032.1 phage tail tape measure protein [Bacillus licheniformis]MEC0491003.1 phage tail tape measure protein [Bacillus licheniformis]MEC5225577.1 phage tail tape measure protein [Bacillus licheniformis]
MSQQLKIVVTPVADTSAQSVEQINKQLKTLQSKLNSLQLKTNINASALKTLKEFSSAVETYQKNLKNYNQTVKETQTVIKNADGTTEKIIQQHKKNGEILQREIKTIDNRNQKIRQETQETAKLTSEIQKLGQAQKIIERQNAQGVKTGSTQKNRDGFKDITYNLDQNGNLKNSTTVTNLDQQRKAIEQLRASLQRLKEQGQLSEVTLSSLGRKINLAQSTEQIEALRAKLKTLDDKSAAVAKTKELERQLELYRRQAQVNTQNLQNRYGSSLSQGSNLQLQQYLSSVNQLTARTPNLRNQMASLNMQFREMSSNIAATTRQTMSFGEQLQVSFSRIPVWAAGMTLFYAPLRLLQDLTSQVISLDTQMTGLRRVMDLPDYKFNELLQRSIDLSDELANKTSDVLTIMNEFGRMGYKDDELLDLTKTAQMMENISELQPEDTVKALTSAMVNFGIQSKDSIKIADALNEIDNNFQTSTLDLAQSMRKSAASAKVYGVSMEQLLGLSLVLLYSNIKVINLSNCWELLIGQSAAKPRLRNVQRLFHWR